MKIVSYENNNGLLTIKLFGRIDSTSAPDYEKEIENVRLASSHERIVLDLDNLDYISSAGLRVILRLLKCEKTLSIINANSEVYEIFQITGFNEMLSISKAYRKISVDGCEVIGQGANGKVYRVDADTIVKMYVNSDALPDIERERELARRAFVLGIPTAIPYDVVKIGNCYGSVFELLNAKSFAKLIDEEPENLDKYIDLSVDLLKKIHSTEVLPTDMPNMKDIAIKWTEFLKEYLPVEKYTKLMALVEEIPVDYHMIHGDYHVKNVMMQNGEVLLIDMDTLCYGHPVFEFGSMYNAYIGFAELDPDTSRKFLGISSESATRIWKRSLELYLNTNDEEFISKVNDKSRLIGYIRLLRRTIRRAGFDTENGRKAIEYYKNSILELLDKVDSLIW